MDAQEEYKVKLDVFEGPLDLLLYLIKKAEVDIYDIPIERITDQYMQYLDLMRMLDLNIAGEFIVMAATLMMIKSRMLLPEEDRAELEDEEEEDPRWDLVRQLVEYKKFKDVAIHLEDIDNVRENVFAREGEGVQLGADPEMALHDVSIFDLISAFNEVLRKVPKEDLREIFAERFTVAEKVDSILDMLTREERISLTELFEGMRSRHEIVCTFLAMLELMKLNQVRAVQEGMFGEIGIMRGELTEVNTDEEN
jgi:segregation and condensation protein A